MKPHKIVLILLLFSVVGIIFYKYNINMESFINHLPISKTIKCFNDNQNLIEFSNGINSIFDKYKIETGELELSTKFTKNDINANRLVAFIPCHYLDKTPKLLNECYLLNKIPENIQQKVNKLVDETDPFQSQVLFGIDLNEESRRVYFNYVYKNKVNLIGFNIEKDSITQKIYAEMRRTMFKNRLNNFTGDKIYQGLIRVFPESTWKTIGTKEDENVTFYRYSSFYINLLYEYKLNYFEDKIMNLLKLFYNEYDDGSLRKWYECFKNNNITWLSIGRDRDDRLFLTIYFVYGREIRNKVDVGKIKEFNDGLKIIKSLITI